MPKIFFQISYFSFLDIIIKLDDFFFILKNDPETSGSSDLIDSICDDHKFTIKNASLISIHW